MTRSELSHRNSGLSLIEVIIYLAILAIFIVSVFLLLNQSLNNIKRVRAKAEIAANAEFVARKIEWAINGAESINFPAVNSSSTQLSVNRFSAGFNPIIFTLSNDKITLSKAGGPAIDITNNKVRVNEFLVEHFSTADNPSTLKVRLIIENLTASMFFVIK